MELMQVLVAKGVEFDAVLFA